MTRRSFAQVSIKDTKDEQKFLYAQQTGIEKKQKAFEGKVQQHDNKIYKLEGEAGVVHKVCNELREDRDERRHERLQKEQEARKAAVGEAKAQERLKTQEQHLDGVMKERDELKHQLAVGDETISKQNMEIGELRAQKATLEIKLEKQEELRATLAAKNKEVQDLRDQRAEKRRGSLRSLVPPKDTKENKRQPGPRAIFAQKCKRRISQKRMIKAK